MSWYRSCSVLSDAIREEPRMKWYYGSTCISDAKDPWLTGFVPDNLGLSFEAVPACQHHRLGATESIRGWLDHLNHGRQIWQRAQRSREQCGILTCFAQLAVSVGLCKRLTLRRTPVIAWTFNVANLYMDFRRHLARKALERVDRFVVHSIEEVAACSRWLDFPEERFRFVPLQRPVWPITQMEDERQPFLLSLGSAKRDYRLLFSVVAELGYRTIVVAAKYAVEGLRIPQNVEIRSNLSFEDCLALEQRARVVAIPIANTTTASGQVTLVDAMMLGRPIVATACPGIRDYMTDGHEGILVNPGDHDALKAALQSLWEDRRLRSSLGTAARKRAMERYTDEAAGKVLGDVLREARHSHG